MDVSVKLEVTGRIRNRNWLSFACSSLAGDVRLMVAAMCVTIRTSHSFLMLHWYLHLMLYILILLSAFTRKIKLPSLLVFVFSHNSWQNCLATWNVPGNFTYKRGLLLIYLPCCPCFFMEETTRMYYIAWPVKQSSVLGLELAAASCAWVRSPLMLFGVMWQMRHYSCEGKHPVL